MKKFVSTLIFFICFINVSANASQWYMIDPMTVTCVPSNPSSPEEPLKLNGLPGVEMVPKYIRNKDGKVMIVLIERTITNFRTGYIFSKTDAYFRDIPTCKLVLKKLKEKGMLASPQELN